MVFFYFRFSGLGRLGRVEGLYRVGNIVWGRLVFCFVNMYLRVEYTGGVVWWVFFFLG